MNSYPEAHHHSEAGAHKVAVVKSEPSTTSGAASSLFTTSKPRSMPIGVLMLLVVLAITLIALIAGAF